MSHIRRIMRDMQELEDRRDELLHVAARPLEHDLTTWHVNVRVADEGHPLAGSVIHLTMKFPPDYPTSAPAINVCTNLPHPNVFRRGKHFELCCDMLGNCGDTVSSAPYQGWSSAYSIMSILLQLQSFLVDPDLMYAQHKVGAAEACAEARAFVCEECGHCERRPSPALST